jgi:hypothetical protein
MLICIELPFFNSFIIILLLLAITLYGIVRFAYFICVATLYYQHIILLVYLHLYTLKCLLCIIFYQVWVIYIYIYTILVLGAHILYMFIFHTVIFVFNILYLLTTHPIALTFNESHVHHTLVTHILRMVWGLWPILFIYRLHSSWYSPCVCSRVMFTVLHRYTCFYHIIVSLFSLRHLAFCMIVISHLSWFIFCTWLCALTYIYSCDIIPWLLSIFLCNTFYFALHLLFFTLNTFSALCLSQLH